MIPMTISKKKEKKKRSCINFVFPTSSPTNKGLTETRQIWGAHIFHPLGLTNAL